MFNKVINHFVETSTHLFLQTSIQGYPGNPSAPRLLATWVTTSAYIDVNVTQDEKVEKYCSNNEQR